MESNESKGGLLATVSLYVAWVIAAVGSIIDAIAIRQAILSLLAIFKVVNQETYRSKGGVGEDIFTNFGISAVDNVFILILGCVAIGVTVWAEYYFRKGRPQGLLYKRIAKVLGAEIGIIILTLIIIEVASVILGNIG
jgi:hypothetical protein